MGMSPVWNLAFYKDLFYSKQKIYVNCRTNFDFSKILLWKSPFSEGVLCKRIILLFIYTIA
jgi:hypothetical protein